MKVEGEDLNAILGYIVQLDSKVIAPGDVGSYMSSSGYQSKVLVGQPAVGKMESSNYKAKLGYGRKINN